MLLGHKETVTALRGLDLAGMLADIERRTIASDWEWTPRPAGGYSDSPAFQDAFIAPRRARKVYHSWAVENVPGVGGHLKVYHRR
jgi:hypothetical protein